LIRNATVSDATAIRELINAYAELDRMLFRSQAEIYQAIRDFQVYESDGRVVGCCALQVYWSDLGEIKSLAIEKGYQGRGIGSGLVRAALAEARRLGLPRVFALTLEREFFERLGFRATPMESLPLKVWSDCIRCPKQDRCDEVALVHDLGERPGLPAEGLHNMDEA